METVTSQAATSCSDVGDDHVEMELEVLSEVQETAIVDGPVENTATEDTECVAELNDPVRNYMYNEKYCACKIILLFVLWFCATGKPRSLSFANMMCCVMLGFPLWRDRM